MKPPKKTKRKPERVHFVGCKAVRRDNLRRLRDDYHTIKELAAAVGLARAQISELTRNKEMGDEIARRIERQLNLEPGSMDIDPHQLTLSESEIHCITIMRAQTDEVKTSLNDLFITLDNNTKLIENQREQVNQKVVQILRDHIKK